MSSVHNKLFVHFGKINQRFIQLENNLKYWNEQIMKNKLQKIKQDWYFVANVERLCLA